MMMMTLMIMVMTFLPPTKEVMGMKEKEPMMDIDEVEEVDIENMTMEELKEFIAAAEAEAEVVGKDLILHHAQIRQNDINAFGVEQ